MSDVNLGRTFGIGPAGRCDEARVGGSVVRWCPDREKFLLWYFCKDHDFPADVAPTMGSGRIALALSDDAIHWERYDGPLKGGAIFEANQTDGAFDSLHVSVIDVTRIGGKWHMWYQGGDDTRLDYGEHGSPKGYAMRSGLAISEDGVYFERMPGNAPGGALVDYLGHSFTAWPNGIISGGEYIVQFTTATFPPKYFGTEYATSKDLKSWVPQGPIAWLTEPTPFEAGGIMTRQILVNPLPEGKKWLMVYTGLSKQPQVTRTIMAAHSDDALSWSHLYREPVFTPGEPGAWDSEGVAIPQLTARNGKLYLSYFGFPTADAVGVDKGIGMAISDTLDLRALRRVSTKT